MRGVRGGVPGRGGAAGRRWRLRRERRGGRRWGNDGRLEGGLEGGLGSADRASRGVLLRAESSHGRRERSEREGDARGRDGAGPRSALDRAAVPRRRAGVPPHRRREARGERRGASEERSRREPSARRRAREGAAARARASPRRSNAQGLPLDDDDERSRRRSGGRPADAEGLTPNLAAGASRRFFTLAAAEGLGEAPASSSRGRVPSSLPVDPDFRLASSAMARDVASKLARRPFFDALNAKEFRFLRSRVRRADLAAGHALCRVGEPRDAVFVILSGVLNAYGDEDDASAAATLKPPEAIADDDRATTTTTRARTPPPVLRERRRQRGWNSASFSGAVAGSSRRGSRRSPRGLGSGGRERGARFSATLAARTPGVGARVPLERSRRSWGRGRSSRTRRRTPPSAGGTTRRARTEGRTGCEGKTRRGGGPGGLVERWSYFDRGEMSPRA